MALALLREAPGALPIKLSWTVLVEDGPIEGEAAKVHQTLLPLDPVAARHTGVTVVTTRFGHEDRVLAKDRHCRALR